MHRRVFLSLTVGGGIAGCTTDTAIPGGRSTADIKNESETIPYNELYRNINDYEGAAVHYDDARITDIDSTTERRQEFIIALDTASWTKEHYLWGVWSGDRKFRKDDEIEFWGTVTGLKTYTSITGERTVPRIEIADIVQHTG